MLIAIDYDATYTADPGLWEQFAADAQRRGHEVVCVTNRSSPPTAPERQPSFRVLAVGSVFKRRGAAAAGLAPQVWVDDMPGTVEPQRFPDWLLGGQQGPHEALDALNQPAPCAAPN